jgi:hypothetical protein
MNDPPRWWRVDGCQYHVRVWPPVRLEFHGEDKDGWRSVQYAWVWQGPRRWRFPHDPEASRSPVLIQGVRLGPLDVRRMRAQDCR